MLYHNDKEVIATVIDDLEEGHACFTTSRKVCRGRGTQSVTTGLYGSKVVETRSTEPMVSDINLGPKSLMRMTGMTRHYL